MSLLTPPSNGKDSVSSCKVAAASCCTSATSSRCILLRRSPRRPSPCRTSDGPGQAQRVSETNGREEPTLVRTRLGVFKARKVTAVASRCRRVPNASSGVSGRGGLSQCRRRGKYLAKVSGERVDRAFDDRAHGSDHPAANTGSLCRRSWRVGCRSARSRSGGASPSLVLVSTIPK